MADTDIRARPDGPGSREPSPAVSALTGFDPSREAYYIALITAIDASGISPGFARVSHECADGFEVTLTIPQTCVDNYASAIEARRAETRSGSVHESAVAKPDAQGGVR